MKLQYKINSLLSLAGIAALFIIFIAQPATAQVLDTPADSNGEELAEPVIQTSTLRTPSDALVNSETSTASVSASIIQNLKSFGALIGMQAVDPRNIVASLIRSSMGFLGIIVLVLILWSGLSFMVSGGDEERTKKAGRSFFNTIIGLIIILSAYSVVTYVFGALTGSNSTSVSKKASVNSNVPDPIANP